VLHAGLGYPAGAVEGMTPSLPLCMECIGWQSLCAFCMHAGTLWCHSGAELGSPRGLIPSLVPDSGCSWLDLIPAQPKLDTEWERPSHSFPVFHCTCVDACMSSLCCSHHCGVRMEPWWSVLHAGLEHPAGDAHMMHLSHSHCSYIG
jgi:hypothetical protein